MNKIQNARFMRAVEANGKLTAEVEFSMELTDRPEEQMPEERLNKGKQKYVAVLEREEGSSYNLRHVYKNDSDVALDWYDNAQHQAYVDVTNSMFGHSQLNKDRESFVLDVLDCEGVVEDIEGRRKA